MRLTRLLYSSRHWRDIGAEWLSSTWGRRFRLGLLTATVVTYPVGTLLFDGPLLGSTFHRRFKLYDGDLPPRLKEIIDSQYELFLRRESRLPKDAVVSVKCSASHEDMDSVARGSLGVRSGAHIALPWYARFESMDEVVNYCFQKLQPLVFLREPACVLWESSTGHDIANTFLLSDNELKFVVLRDLYAHDGYAAYVTKALSFATFTAFTSLFTYWFHQRPMFGGGAIAWTVIYCFFTGLGVLGAKEWSRLYRFVADIHADAASSSASFEHSEGGKEYYWKMLRRNRLLREMTPEGILKVTAAGDLRNITTPFVTRYDHLKDVKSEDDQLKDVVQHDD